MIAYYGVLLLGGIVVNANPMYAADGLKHIASTTERKILVTVNDVLPTRSAMGGFSPEILPYAMRMTTFSSLTARRT